MKIILTHFLFLYFSIPVLSQVGINTETPQITLEVVSSNKETPSKNDGILIPRVSELIQSDEINNGMLVFLKSDYENYKKGFYWKNESYWIPFFSTNQMKADQTIALVNTNSRFVESLVINSNTSNSVRQLTFDSSTLKVNDINNFSINSNGELVVMKPGKYVIQSIITIEAETTDAARDAIDIEVLKNGALLNPSIGSTLSYPNTTGGNVVKNSTSVNGFVNLNSGDRLSLRFNRYYRDSNGTVLIKPIGNISTFTLRYIGS